MPAVIAVFQSPESAEQAVSELSLNGFTEKDVAMVLFSAISPTDSGRGGILGWLSRGGVLGDTLDRSDGVSVMDGISIGSVILGLIGLVWGSRSYYGPVAMGTLGMLLGGIVGLLVDRLIPEKRRDMYETARIPGLIMLQVTSSAADRVKAAKQILERNQAKQVAELPNTLEAMTVGEHIRNT